jgi:hypothetical protein
MTPEQLQQIAQAFINVCVAVLSALTPVLAGIAAWKLRQVLQDKQLLDLARVAVLAAEQLGVTAQIKNKRDFAIRYLTDALQRRGVSVPVAEIEAAIEAAVMREFNQQPTIESIGLQPPA